MAKHKIVIITGPGGVGKTTISQFLCQNLREEFRETILIPKYEEAVKSKQQLKIELDGGYGYATSFLEESFGGLARIYQIQEVLDTLLFVSEDEPGLIDEITEYIKNARQERK